MMDAAKPANPAAAAAARRGAARSIGRGILLSEHLVLWLCPILFLAALPFTPALASPANLGNLLSSLLPLLVAAVGATFVLISGGIDLSAASVISLASVAGALVMTGEGGPLAGSALAMPAGVAVMLAAGSGVGALNGAAVAFLGLPPFIVTLTTMMFFGGMAVWLTRSATIYLLPASFELLGGNLLVALAIAGGLTAAAWWVLGRTVAGRWLHAVGGNRRTAAVSGVPVRMVTAAAYAASGLFAAFASVLYTARLETGDPVLGKYLLLDIIGAAVIGGNSLFGGKGKVAWTLGGVLFIALLDNVLTLLDLSPFSILMAKGLVILAAALLDAARNRILAGD